MKPKNTICLWFDKDAHEAARYTEAFSFQIATDNQEETDRYWSAIVGNGGEESQCGWCKDRWGLSLPLVWILGFLNRKVDRLAGEKSSRDGWSEHRGRASPLAARCQRLQLHPACVRRV